MKNHKKRVFIAAIIAAAPSLVMGAFPLFGYAPWGRSSLDILVFAAIIYSVVHVLAALVVMLLARKPKDFFPSIMLGIFLGGIIGLQLGTAMRMEGYERAGERATPLIHAVETYIEKAGAPPQHLDQLVPEFLELLPADIPPFKIVTGDKARKSYYSNDWALVFDAGSGLNWDALVYLPKQNYQEIESKTLLGNWVYLHE
jgi:hypothetical protein